MRIKSILCGGIAVLSCTVTAIWPFKKKNTIVPLPTREEFEARQALIANALAEADANRIEAARRNGNILDVPLRGHRGNYRNGTTLP